MLAHDPEIASEYFESDPYLIRDVRTLQNYLARAQAKIRLQRDELNSRPAAPAASRTPSRPAPTGDTK